MRRFPCGRPEFWIGFCAFLTVGCQKDGPAAPAPAVGEGHYAIPVPQVPRRIDVGTSHPKALAAKRELSSVVGLARVVLVRTESPARMLHAIRWSAEVDGCPWVRIVNPIIGSLLLTACPVGDRIEWRGIREAKVQEPGTPRPQREDLILYGWSLPDGMAGRLVICEPGDTTRKEDRAEWQRLPDGVTIRWHLTQFPTGGETLDLTLLVTEEGNRTRSYDFTLADSARWSGRLTALGTEGSVSAYRWRPQPDRWVLWDSFVWGPGYGRWTHHGPEPDSIVTAWGETPKPAR